MLYETTFVLYVFVPRGLGSPAKLRIISFRNSHIIVQRLELQVSSVKKATDVVIQNTSFVFTLVSQNVCKTAVHTKFTKNQVPGYTKISRE